MNRPAHALPRGRRRTAGFSLVEVLVATAVLAAMVILLVRVTGDAASILTRTSAKVDQFREARAAFEALTTRLAQATLNAYWDYQYDNPTSPTRIPVKYTRRSELRFIAGPSEEVLGTGTRDRPTHCVFFQAPFGETEARTASGAEEFAGFENLLCAWGYFIEYAGDLDQRPPFLSAQAFPPRHRYRLMELRSPAEENPIYRFTSGLTPAQQNYSGREWFRSLASAPPNSRTRAIAENVVAMIITPRLAQADEAPLKTGRSADFSPLAPNYLYDSAPTTTAYADGRVNPVHQLPPLLQVTLVAIDEVSAQRLNLGPQAGDPFKLRRRGRFSRTADFSRDLLQQGDSDSLENELIRQRVGYRIFNSNVVIRGAKWSRETTN